MKNVLFLVDKWCSGNPNLGLSNHFHHLFHTFSYCCPELRAHTLHFDESAMYGQHINNVLYQYCQTFGIDTVFVCLLGNSGVNPSLECLNSLKGLGITLCAFWCDNNPTEIMLQDATREIFDLNIVLDYPTSDLHNQRRAEHLASGKYLYLWTPESKFLYYPDRQDVEVSFIGSLRYPDRAEYARRLKVAYPDIFIRGGQREECLSPEGYASLIRRSKININFSRNMDGYSQAKGRVFEAVASKTLLFEEKNDSTPNFLSPDLDYVEFSNIDDLIYKIQIYIDDPKICAEIAENGYNRFMGNWTAEMFWKTIIDKIS